MKGKFYYEAFKIKEKFLKSQTLDVTINCEAFDSKQHTSKKKGVGTGQTYWGEHLFFIKKIENESFLFSHQLKIQVRNYHCFGKDSIVNKLIFNIFILVYR